MILRRSPPCEPIPAPCRDAEEDEKEARVGMHLLAHHAGDRQPAYVEDDVKPCRQPPDFRASSHEKSLIDKQPYVTGQVKVTSNRRSPTCYFLRRGWSSKNAHIRLVASML